MRAAADPVGAPRRPNETASSGSCSNSPASSNVHEADGRLQFEFAGGDEEQVALVGRLVAAGFPVLEFSAHSAGLEDLFIEDHDRARVQ